MPMHDRLLFAESWVTLLLADIWLSFFRLTTLLAMAQWFLKPTDEAATGVNFRAEAAGVRRIVDLAARYHFYPMTCLRKSFVLFLILRRRRIPCSLKIGVQIYDGKLKSHAWVEQAESQQRPQAWVEMLSI